MADCSHLASVLISELPEVVEGCADCLVTGDPWCHLRICLTCGHVGCCDDSPNRHARVHAVTTGHQLIRSIQPGEDWSWCFADKVATRIAGVHGSPQMPPSPM